MNMPAPAQPAPAPEPTPERLDYLLRRAEQESIAAIRTVDPRAAEPHAQMASEYSARALSLLGQVPASIVVQGVAPERPDEGRR